MNLTGLLYYFSSPSHPILNQLKNDLEQLIELEAYILGKKKTQF